MKSSNANSQFKNVIFDLGGVLLEWNPADFLKRMELPSHLVEVFESLLWATHDGGCLSREEVIAKLPEKYDKTVFAYCVKHLAPQLRPIDEMIELFHDLRRKGYRVYILSNMPEELHQELVALHDFFKYSDGEVYSYAVKAIKPQPQIYKALLETYELQGPESIFIDDREDNIRVAESFGIQGILCKSPLQVQEELLKLLCKMR